MKSKSYNFFTFHRLAWQIRFLKNLWGRISRKAFWKCIYTLLSLLHCYCFLKIKLICETWLSSTNALLTHLCDTYFIHVSLNPARLCGAELQCLTLGILAHFQLKMHMCCERFLVSVWAVVSVPFSLLMDQLFFFLWSVVNPVVNKGRYFSGIIPVLLYM